MKKLNHFYLGLLGAALLAFSACSNNDDNPGPQGPLWPDNYGLYVLNEGNSNAPSTLGFWSYNDGTYTENAHNVSIGNGANDMTRYGAKVYVSVTNTNEVLVLGADSLNVLKRINLNSPRFLLPYRGKVYITNGENQLTVIDTSSFSPTSIQVGRSPEQLAANNGKIYVANSGWRDAATSGYDNRVSVVNVSSFTVENNIVVADNISVIAADTVKNMLYVNANAVYEGSNIKTPSKLYTINTANNEVKSLEFGAEAITIIPDAQVRTAFMVSSNRSSDGKNTFISMNLDNQTVQSFDSSAQMTNPYSVSYVPELGWVIIGDANDYSSKGSMNVLQYYNGSFQYAGKQDVGVIPKKFVFSVPVSAQ